MPFLIFGAIGLLVWLSRKAPHTGSLAPALPPPSPPPPAPQTVGRLAAPYALAVYGGQPQHVGLAAVSYNLAVAAVQAAMTQLQLTGHRGGGGGGHGGGYYGGGSGFRGLGYDRGGWGGGDIDYAVEDSPYGYGTTPTDARPMLTAGGGHGGHGGHGHGGRRYGGGGWYGGWGPGYGWYGPPLEIVDAPAPMLVAVPVSDDAARIVDWALTSAPSRTIRALMSQHAANPAVVARLSQRLAHIEPQGF